MTKIPNFGIKVTFEGRALVNKKADKLEEFDPLFEDLKKKFR